MFAMFEPRTLPITIPLACSKDAVSEEASSGTDVPIDTRVNPIMNSEIPNLFAIDEDDITKRSAPFTSRIRPPKRRRTSVKYTFKCELEFYLNISSRCELPPN
jgi:hypothetical protein